MGLPAKNSAMMEGALHQPWQACGLGGGLGASGKFLRLGNFWARLRPDTHGGWIIADTHGGIHVPGVARTLWPSHR